MIMLHHHLTAAVCAVLIANVAPSAAGRALTDLDQGWRFSESPVGTGQETAAFDDSAWAAVSLPHTWNRLGAREGSASADTYKGAAWYRLHFKAPRAARGARYYLQFDGVGTIADVWLNGKHLGRHEGAFARFRFDATKAIVRTGDNLLAVRADNSAPAPGSPTADVIPLSGDFFVEGGLYRKVALIVAAPLHIDLMDFGGPGVYARALAIGERTATVEVRTRLADDGARQAARLVVRIENAEGKTVAAATQTARVGPRAPAVRTFRLTVPHPHLWDGMSDPYFYQVVVSLKGRRGVVIDEVTQPLGLRTMRFDAEKGFFLNGRHLFLRSVSLHQDAAGKGWAMSCADQKRDFDLVADVGANAVRLAHYQHDQCSYDEADRRGMIVWAEIPLVNQVSFDGGPPSPGLAENARRQLSELIRQNYNHPSVVMWSVGNETDLKAVTTNGPGKAGALISSLAVLARHDDPSRPTTYADCCEQSPAPDRDVLVGLTDLLGYNRYFGWYYGEANDFGAMLDKAHAAHPSLPIGVSEYGAGAALTQHSDDPAGGEINPHGRPHPEEYQDVYHEQSWQLIAARPYLWGAYIWNMFDFASVGRQEGDLVGMNDKGLVSYDRAIRKDAFYFYRANWSTAPTLHLVGRRYVDRPYAVLDIKAYRNATRAGVACNWVLVPPTAPSAITAAPSPA